MRRMLGRLAFSAAADDAHGAARSSAAIRHPLSR
jgi:hypothetical protein